MLRPAAAAFVAAFSLHVPAPLHAQDYPAQKIQLIVPYSAGSGVDLLARSFGQALEKHFRVSIVIENREGATGIIGGQAAARAPADGYTIMINANPPFAVAPLSVNPPPYDVLKAFAPIARVGSVPLVMITGADSPIRSFAQLKTFANANPDKAMYASTGNGSPGQLAMESLKARLAMKFTEVPYKSSTQALADVMGGHILASVVSLPAADQLIAQGRLRVIAVGSKERLAKFPDAPTLAEAVGDPSFEASVWYGFLAPAAVPPERIKVLSAAIAKAMDTKETKDSMTTLAIIPDLLPPAEFAEALRRDVDSAQKMLALVAKSGAGR